MHIKQGNLYDFTTCLGYRRYFIYPIGRVWSGGIGGHYISKGERGAHSGKKTGAAGPKGEGGQPAGGDNGRTDGGGEHILWW